MRIRRRKTCSRWWTGYHEHCPVFVRPSTGAANAKELRFDKLDSGYKVGTAGSRAWAGLAPSSYSTGSGVGLLAACGYPCGRGVAGGAGCGRTEVILESTANGVGNLFHESGRMQMAGIGEFIAIFVPWYWQDEYRKIVPRRLQPER